jgi:hypothetical protein
LWQGSAVIERLELQKTSTGFLAGSLSPECPDPGLRSQWPERAVGVRVPPLAPAASRRGERRAVPGSSFRARHALPTVGTDTA